MRYLLLVLILSGCTVNPEPSYKKSHWQRHNSAIQAACKHQIPCLIKHGATI